MKPTLHLLGIPHTITRAEFSHDAFTNKVRSFAPCLQGQGYSVVYYGVEGAESGAEEQIDLYPEDEYWSLIGDAIKDKRKPWHEVANVNTPWYERFMKALEPALRERVDRRNDIICVPFGTAYKDVLDKFPLNDDGYWMIESGIGYPNSYLNHRVFESYAWMHNTIGRQGGKVEDGRDYFWVVPNPFDLEEWPSENPQQVGEPYVLFIGRIGSTKGTDIFVEMAKLRPDLLFVMVGQGDPQPYLNMGLSNLEYREPVSGTERIALYANALATVCMTRFLEPFGQTHIESQLCGTPVITSNFGVFTETVRDNENGYRCNTLGDCMAALERAHEIDRYTIWLNARSLWGAPTVGRQYDRVFQQMADLQDKGYMTMRSSLGPITKVREVNPAADWEEAQEWEREWWMNKEEQTKRWEREIRKQDLYYIPKMLMPSVLDFGNAGILDIGCGPVSILIRSKFDHALALDPLDFNDAEAYAKLGINRVYAPAETFETSVSFNEVWLYNVLQHVQNVDAVITMMKNHCVPGGMVRIFEWLNVGLCSGHIHNLKVETFEAAFVEWERVSWEVGNLQGELVEMHPGDYLAAVLRKPIEGAALSKDGFFTDEKG